MSKEQFTATVWGYYQGAGRHDLPWRVPLASGSFDPYHILVSELMLQQTQVGRVIPKYSEFLEQFPSVDSLAAAELGDVLRAWSGLGYNRRAKFLHQAAQQIATRAEFPSTLHELTTLPGIGKNTAGAILAYAYNQPVVFVETNIRTAYIHHFFAEAADVSDDDILLLVAATLDLEHPREWYWALMDYGSFLKRERGNLNKLSKSYVKQSSFEGSRRQVRGQIIKLLTIHSRSEAYLHEQIHDHRFNDVIEELVKEGLVKQTGTIFTL